MASLELKSVDVSISQVSDTTGAITLLNGVARGDDVNQRIGRKVSSHALELRLHRSVVSPSGTRQISQYSLFSISRLMLLLLLSLTFSLPRLLMHSIIVTMLLVFTFSMTTQFVSTRLLILVRLSSLLSVSC